jgi:hypothetical protein
MSPIRRYINSVVLDGDCCKIYHYYDILQHQAKYFPILRCLSVTVMSLTCTELKNALFWKIALFHIPEDRHFSPAPVGKPQNYRFNKKSL